MKKLLGFLLVGLLLAGCSGEEETQLKETGQEDFHLDVNRDFYEMVDIHDVMSGDYLDEDIAVSGVLSEVYGLLEDSYGNIRFILKQDDDSLESFWYNTDSAKTNDFYNELENAIKENRTVTLYGEYQNDPKQVGNFNLFVHDIDIFGSRYSYSGESALLETEDEPIAKSASEMKFIEIPNYCSKIAQETVTTSEGEVIYLFPEDDGIHHVMIYDGKQEIPEIWYHIEFLSGDLGCIRKKISGQEIKNNGTPLTEKDLEEIGDVDLTAEDYDTAVEGFVYLAEQFKRIGEEHPDLLTSATAYAQAAELSSEVVTKYRQTNEFDTGNWNEAGVEMSMGWNAFRPLVIEAGLADYFNAN